MCRERERKFDSAKKKKKNCNSFFFSRIQERISSIPERSEGDPAPCKCRMGQTEGTIGRKRKVVSKK